MSEAAEAGALAAAPAVKPSERHTAVASAAPKEEEEEELPALFVH